ncbi:inactive protein RESTRICTED TEV MOVEMENT 2 [Glycine max]|uniref:inactive protein RESTRICTED TEV MOVEMENT 2 n=1 Tax=Glycine max TaxID=3847 RepID=UPI0003DE8476|nr:inactive protein RESTRICTED TEV MOVEMENT 2 [Glycine max]|eukprot:XP_006582807.1 inactive protein RESTRICTED TEV MOVEMENT 2 [Glycine max]
MPHIGVGTVEGALEEKMHVKSAHNTVAQSAENEFGKWDIGGIVNDFSVCFAREHIGAKTEYDFGRVRVHGERSLGNNRRARFNALYQVPKYCDINKIKGKFDGKTVIITIPTIPGKVPKKETQPTEQEPPKEPSQEAESNPEEEKEGTPPSDDNQESKEEAGHATSTSNPPNASQEESMDQKGQEGIPQKATLNKVESEKHVGQEASSTSTPPKDTQESKAQKGQEGIPTKVDSKTQVAHEASSTSTPPQDTQESCLKRGQEAIPPNATPTTNAKLQGEEKFEGEIDENVEKQKVLGKEETKDHSEKPLESGKPPEKAVVDDSPKKEGKEESKGLAAFEGEMRREINGKISNDVGRKSDKKAKPDSTIRATIKEVTASASQAMTSLAKKFNEEDKQRIAYMGTAVLAVALGVYATYKLRSRVP